MVNNPAVLISDDLIQTLESEAIYRAPFIDITGTIHPWEIDYSKIRDIRAQLQNAEVGLRQAYPDKDITCVLAGTGAFWMPKGGLEKFLEQMEIPLKSLKASGPIPTWKLTTGEVFSSHLSNMRQLILAVSHDLVLLDQLRESLGTNHDFLHREFERCERSVRLLLDEIKSQGPNLANAVSDTMMLYERARITREIIERGEMAPDDLGYSLEDLENAQKILDERCKKELPAFQNRLDAIYQQMKGALRNGESSQLTRSSRWEFAFSLLGQNTPKGFGGQAIVAENEREGLMSVVASREEELGESEEGKQAMVDAQQAIESKGGKPPEPPKEEPKEPEPESESAKKKKDTRRMAFTSRRR